MRNWGLASLTVLSCKVEYPEGFLSAHELSNPRSFCRSGKQPDIPDPFDTLRRTLFCYGPPCLVPVEKERNKSITAQLIQFR